MDLAGPLTPPTDPHLLILTDPTDPFLLLVPTGTSFHPSRSCQWPSSREGDFTRNQKSRKAAYTVPVPETIHRRWIEVPLVVLNRRELPFWELAAFGQCSQAEGAIGVRQVMGKDLSLTMLFCSLAG